MSYRQISKDSKMKNKNYRINFTMHSFSIYLRTGSNPADINWFWSHTKIKFASLLLLMQLIDSFLQTYIYIDNYSVNIYLLFFNKLTLILSTVHTAKDCHRHIFYRVIFIIIFRYKGFITFIKPLFLLLYK